MREPGQCSSISFPASNDDMPGMPISRRTRSGRCSSDQLERLGRVAGLRLRRRNRVRPQAACEYRNARFRDRRRSRSGCARIFRPETDQFSWSTPQITSRPLTKCAIDLKSGPGGFQSLRLLYLSTSQPRLRQWKSSETPNVSSSFTMPFHNVALLHFRGIARRGPGGLPFRAAGGAGRRSGVCGPRTLAAPAGLWARRAHEDRNAIGRIFSPACITARPSARRSR